MTCHSKVLSLGSRIAYLLTLASTHNHLNHVTIMETVYRDLPIDPRENEFRLLTIVSAPADAKSQCHISTASLLHVRQILDHSGTDAAAVVATLIAKRIGTDSVRTDAELRFTWGDFAALSYVWDDPTEISLAQVNGVDTQITKNLADALRWLRQTGDFCDKFKLWVDGLCINQAENAECGQQVASMRQYYSIAWSVVGYLGLASDHSRQALALMRDLADLSHDQCIALANQLSGLDSCNAMSESWYALSRFVCRPYRTRLWIMQELALGGDKTLFCCGADTISWSVISRAMDAIHGPLWLAKHTANELGSSYEQQQPRLREVDNALYHIKRDLETLADCKALSQAPQFVKMIEISSFSHCTDPRDRVYGMLGVVDWDVAMRIDPNYMLEADEVFMRVAEAHLEAHCNVEFLRAANLWGTSASPSWASDWTWTGRLRDSRPDDNIGPAMGARRPNDNLKRRSYTARLGLPFTPPKRSGRLLQCKAAFSDVVDGLGTNQMIEMNRPSIVQPRATHSAYGDFQATACQLDNCLYADRRRVIGKVITLLNPPLDIDDAKAQFAELGWERFLNDIDFCHRWVDWCKCNESLLVGGVEFKHYLS